jgi:hypothetical protein
MNPADWQPSGNLGNLGVIARQDIAVAALMARLAFSLPNRAPFGLPRLSMPKKTTARGNERSMWNGSLLQS